MNEFFNIIYEEVFGMDEHFTSLDLEGQLSMRWMAASRAARYNAAKTTLTLRAADMTMHVNLSHNVSKLRVRFCASFRPSILIRCLP
jgi:hypothetical protein